MADHSLKSRKSTGYGSPPSHLPTGHENRTLRMQLLWSEFGETQLKHHFWMCFRCATCAQVNPKGERKTLEVIQAQGNGTGKTEY